MVNICDGDIFYLCHIFQKQFISMADKIKDKLFFSSTCLNNSLIKFVDKAYLIDHFIRKRHIEH